MGSGREIEIKMGLGRGRGGVPEASIVQLCQIEFPYVSRKCVRRLGGKSHLYRLVEPVLPDIPVKQVRCST